MSKSDFAHRFKGWKCRRRPPDSHNEKSLARATWTQLHSVTVVIERAGTAVELIRDPAIVRPYIGAISITHRAIVCPLTVMLSDLGS